MAAKSKAALAAGNMSPEDVAGEIKRLFEAKLIASLQEPDVKASLLDVARRYLQDPAKLPKPAPEPVKPEDMPFQQEPAPIPAHGAPFNRISAADLPFKVPT